MEREIYYVRIFTPAQLIKTVNRIKKITNIDMHFTLKTKRSLLSTSKKIPSYWFQHIIYFEKQDNWIGLGNEDSALKLNRLSYRKFFKLLKKHSKQLKMEG